MFRRPPIADAEAYVQQEAKKIELEEKRENLKKHLPHYAYAFGIVLGAIVSFFNGWAVLIAISCALGIASERYYEFLRYKEELNLEYKLAKNNRTTKKVEVESVD